MARKRKLSQSSEDEFVASDSGADDAYTPNAAGSSRKASTKIAKRTGAAPKKAAKKSRTRKDDASADTDTGNHDVVDAVARPHATSAHTITQARAIRTALLAWYDTVRDVRRMPWRKPFSHSWSEEERAQRAYEVWISEIMLQQTQVVTVIPYYNKWMTRFPTIHDLAMSDVDTVNGLWKGLGYYSRAARILQGAQKAVSELGGRLPGNAQDMEALIPGIGRYSAGAICSIAYNQCVPVLDGNVHRLLSRFLALYTLPKAKQGLDVLWAGANSVVEGADRPGDTNQALIELGSTVCKVRLDTTASSSEQVSPDMEDLCTLCRPLPIPTLATSFPMKVDRKKAREELDVVSVVEWRAALDDSDRWFLLVRRPDGGLLAGLHEFPTAPNVSVTSARDLAECAQSALRQLLVHPPRPPSPAAGLPHRHSDNKSLDSEGDLRIANTRPAGDVLHIFSHIRKTYRVQWVFLVGGRGAHHAGEGEQPVADGPGCVSDSGNPPPAALPPALRPSPRLCAAGQSPEESGPAKLQQASASGSKKEKRKKMSMIAADSVQDSAHPESMWVRMDDVAAANIGTGVLKVWKQVRTLWDPEPE